MSIPADPGPDGKLRILFVTSDKFPPFRPAAKALFSDEMTRRGHVVDWIIQADSEAVSGGRIEYGNGIALVGATDDGESRLCRLRKYCLDILNDLRVFSLVRSRKYDVLQVKDKYIAAIFCLIASRLYRVPYFFWLAYPHAEASIYAAREGVARYRAFYLLRGYFQKFVLYRIILPRSRHVFVQSEQMRRDLSAEGIAMDKMTAVPSSVNLPAMQAHTLSGSVARTHDEKWVVYLGTLIAERRLDFLVRVIARVRKHVPGARLLLVGEGHGDGDRRLILDAAEESNVADGVTITGWLPMAQAWDYVRLADVCLSPYYPTFILRSTSPTKLVEYLAFGKAVVANDHPEQAEVIAKSRAGICCAWDEDAFAAAIVRMLSDDDERAAMGKRGFDYVVAERTHERLAQLVLDTYAANGATRTVGDE